MRPEPLEKSLRRFKDLGYTSVELAGEPERYEVEETKRLLSKYDIKCWGTVTIMFGKRDLIASDPKQRHDTVQYVKGIVSLCAALGGEIVTVVPGTVGKIAPTASAEEEWKWAVEGLKEIAQFAQEKNIRVGIEPLNRFETYFINRSDQALALADEVGFGTGIAFDPFHIALEEKDLIGAIHRCRGRIIDFHVGDNNRLAAGDGSFDWAAIVAALKEARYDGHLAAEPMPPVDRTPIGKFGMAQIDENPEDSTPGELQFIQDHASALFSEEYYTYLLKRTAETLKPLL